MAHETSKAFHRRAADMRFATRYFVGVGLDVGAGPDGLSQQKELFPRISSVRDWDLKDGDAQELAGVKDGAFDFVHSSHCLEHMVDPRIALINWWRVLRGGGHLIVIVPDEDMYEHGFWPSRFNSDHKWTFTIFKHNPIHRRSLNLLPFISALCAEHDNEAGQIKKIEQLDTSFRNGLSSSVDQTAGPLGECGIEFIIRKVRK